MQTYVDLTRGRTDCDYQRMRHQGQSRFHRPSYCGNSCYGHDASV